MSQSTGDGTLDDAERGRSAGRGGPRGGRRAGLPAGLLPACAPRTSWPPPQRLAAVAAGARRLAAAAAAGPARIVRGAGGRRRSTLDPGSDVIDIVTDDMPFLVDSITMELARHGLSARLIVHPQLRVRRTADGAMAGVSGLVNGAGPTRDELAESWMHIEIARLADGEAKLLADDLQRVLRDVRVAVEDCEPDAGPARSAWPHGRWPAARAARTGAGRGRTPRSADAAALAGRRPLHVPRLPRVRPGPGRRRAGPAGRARHRAGHPAARPARPGLVRRAAARGGRAGPRPRSG